MSATNKKLPSAVRAVIDEAVTTLQKLVQIPSVTGNEQLAQEYLLSVFSYLGLKFDFWCPSLDELKNHPAFPMVSSANLGNRPNLVGIHEGTGGGRSLILNGHIDVVDPGAAEKWSHGPWSGAIEKEKLYGRGACDMKAGLLAGVFALEAVRRAGIKLKGNVYIESVIGEEDGGSGTLACLVRGYRADGAIVLEPTQLFLTPAQMGSLNFRLTVTGKAAHGSVRYEGVSAVEKFSYLHAGLLEWEAQRDKETDDLLYQHCLIKAPLCIGTVHAGNWSSTVPEKLVAEGRYGFHLNETLTQARKAFEEKISALAAADPWLRQNPPLVEWINASWEPATIETNHQLVAKMKESFQEALHREPMLAGVPYGSDMRLLTRYGQIPTLIFGPGDVRKAHFTDEYVPLGEYAEVISVLANFIVSWCNQE